MTAPARVSARARVGSSAVVSDKLCQPEVQHLHVAVGAHHDVLRLDVAVDDAARAPPRAPRRPAGDESISSSLSGRRDQVAQRPALDELRGDEVRAVQLADVVDGDDVRVVERGDGAGLALEAANALGRATNSGGQDLERDLAARAASRARGRPRPCRPRRASFRFCTSRSRAE